jgi:hypothetical protein
MDYRRGDQSCFEAARGLAARMIQESSQGDGFTLILLAEPNRVIIGEPAFDPQDVIDEIKALSVTHTGANLVAALSEIELVVNNARQQHPRLNSARVVFFSDLGKNSWEEAVRDDVRPVWERLSQIATLLMVDVGLAGRNNLAVTSLIANESLPTIERRIEFTAAIENYSSQDMPQLPVTFRVDEQHPQTQKVDVPAGGSAAVIFSHMFETAGDHAVDVQFPDDALPVDNQRWLSVPVREAISVLAIEGTPGSAAHLALALEPHKAPRPRVLVDLGPENLLLERELGKYDAVFLANVGQIGSDEANVLRDYCNSGGGLVIFLGDQVDIAQYNRVLGKDDQRPALLPAELLSVSETSLVTLDPLDYRHPIVAPFRGNERSGLLTTPIWKYVRLAVDSRSAARIALAMSNSDPAIVEQPYGRGRCVLIATAASDQSIDRRTTPPTPWSAWSTWPSFPPIVQQLLAVATSGRARSRNFETGQVLEAIVPATNAGSFVELIGAMQSGQRVPIELDGEYGHWSFVDTYLSGVYRAEYGSGPEAIQLYVANVDPVEGRLERIDDSQLPRQFDKSVAATENSAAAIPLAARSTAYRYLLAGVLGLLLVETFLAYRFGNAR